MTALSYVIDESTQLFVPEVQKQQQEEEQEKQEASMHDLLEAILEQEAFLGSVYY
jgi:DNA-binding TFAR19-related protein (PDSD5 family)